MDAGNFSLEDFKKWMQQNAPPTTHQHGHGKETDWDWERAARGFGASYVVLGLVAILLNASIVYSLLKKRRKTFQHAFYIMILNFTLIDTLKGICSILFALKLLKSDMGSQGSLWTVRVDQYSGMLLRFSNLATILNLLIITLNEYIFICYPLRYSMLVTRGRVVLLVIASWVVSSSVTIIHMLAGSMSQTIMIDQECTLIANRTSSCVLHLESSISSHLAYHGGIIAFCIACLAVTAYSYSILLRVISSLVKADLKQNAEMEQLKVPGEDSSGHQVVRRHKYVVVIGSVIAVYSVYLLAYALIQGIQLVNVSQDFTAARGRGIVYLKYVCYLFVSLHSVLQPLCYFRMREFRSIMKRALCGRRRRESVMTENCYLSGHRGDHRNNSQRAHL